jgi:aspartyl-tRNA synthetase
MGTRARVFASMFKEQEPYIYFKLRDHRSSSFFYLISEVTAEARERMVGSSFSEAKKPALVSSYL